MNRSEISGSAVSWRNKESRGTFQRNPACVLRRKTLTEATESEPIVAGIIPVVIVVPGVVIVPVVIVVLVVPGVIIVIVPVVVIVVIVPVVVIVVIVPVIIVVILVVVIVLVLVVIVVLALAGDVSGLGRSKQRELNPFVVLCKDGGGAGHFFELVAGHGSVADLQVLTEHIVRGD